MQCDGRALRADVHTRKRGRARRLPRALHTCACVLLGTLLCDTSLPAFSKPETATIAGCSCAPLSRPALLMPSVIGPTIGSTESMFCGARRGRALQ